MSKLDFNRAPYFDDFDDTKNFMKVLFQPGRPVQGRELNQIQSILQNQVTKFANHIFKNGAKVSNAVPRLYACSYVRLLNSPDVSIYTEGTQLLGETSGIKATLVKPVNAVDGDPATLYVVYTGTAVDGETSTFIPGENIKILDDAGIPVQVVTVRCPSCPGSGLTDVIAPTGRGQLFTIGEGIIYFEGMFINVNKQDIIVTKYLVRDGDNYTGYEPCKIGLDFVQTIVTSEDDASLLDPALGYPNSTAPGADRYKVELVLTKRPYDSDDGENFVLLCKIGEGMRIEYMKSDSEYADLMDMLAKRTYEQAGDYTIRPFRVNFMNARKTSPSDPNGYSTNGDPDKLVALVSPSVAYVKGYRVETTSDTPVLVDKARDTNQVSSFVKHFDNRTYVLGNVKGASIWPNPFGETSILSPGTSINIYNGVTDGSAASGVLIGTMKVSDIEYVSGDLTTDTAVYRYFIYDLNILSGHQFSEAKSFVKSETGFFVNAVDDPVSGSPEVYNTNKTALIYRLDRDDVKTLRSIDDPNNGSVSVIVRKKLNGVADGAGSVTFTTATNEYFNSAGSSFIGWYVQGGTTTSFNPGAVSAFTPTSLTLNLGAGAAGASVYCIIEILKTNQTEKTKTYTTATVQTSIAPPATIGDEVALNLADVIRINSINLFLSGSPESPIADVTDEFRLDDGITDMFYGMSKIVRTKASSVALVADHRLAINLSYYDHSGNQGYFTVDSYASALADSGSGVTYETLPVYTATNGDKFPVASSIDFRSINLPATPSQGVLPANNTTAIFDIEYYLGRADLIQISKDGKIYAKRGTPSDTPRCPKPDDFAMPIYEVYLSPYTYSLKDIRTKYIDNRRYTMRDIGSIDKRLQNVEYITALNVLEKSAADMAIKDENGLDRFKNGFIADNFQDFQAADLESKEFKAAADRSTRQLRPSFKARNRRLVLNESKSSGYIRRGNVAMLPYSESVAVEQAFATKSVSINPYLIYTQKGSMVLSPNNDVWSDEDSLPRVTIDVDSGMESLGALADANGVLGTDWGSWIDQNRTTVGRATDMTTIPLDNGGTQTNTTTTTTTTNTKTSTRTGTVTTVESRTDSYSIDDIVKDVQIIPFIRSKRVEFYVTKLKPFTRVYAFFDGQNVSAFCRDIGFQLSSNNASTATQLVEYGSPLITDANGELRGEFLIPGGRFFTGDRKFVLTDDSTFSGDPDLETTRAEAMYFAGGLDVTKQDVTLNIVTPEFKQSQVTETTTSTSSDTSRETTTDITAPPPGPVIDPPPPAPPALCLPTGTGIFPDNRVANTSIEAESCRCALGRRSWECNDPIAQGFLVEEDMFISSVDVYFKTVDIVSDRIFVDIRTMVNGYPGPTKLVTKEFTPDQIAPFCSEDSTVPFKVEFSVPVYVEKNNQYCIVVGGASPNTRVWVAHLGQEVVNMPGKIVETPPTGQVSFRSLNGSTWNAEQFEQVKFKLYRANFEAGEMSLTFENDHSDDVWVLEENPLQFQSGSTKIRVFQKNHGLTPGDRVSLSLFDSEPFRIKYSDFVPQIGQFIHTTTGGGYVDTITSTNVENEYMVTLRQMSGVMTSGQTYTGDSLVKTVRDSYLVDSIGSKRAHNVTLNQCFGQVLENNFSIKYPGAILAGVPIAELNTEWTSSSIGHSVTAVDSMDSFIINVSTPATMTGRFGGQNIKLYKTNEKYEMFNVSGAYLAYRSSESWTLSGIAHGPEGTPFESMDYNRMPAVSFNTQEDKFLGQPYKIASSANESVNLGGDKSIEVNAKFGVRYGNLSPMINLDTFSITTVSNRVEWLDPAALAQEPAGVQNFWSEEDPINGSESFKYVTKTVNLANPANDLNIFVDVFRDLNADFDIYVKTLPVYGEGTIESQPWQKAQITKSRSSVDLTDFIEYHVVASEQIVPYTSNGDSYPGWSAEPFSSFKVKIVGRTKNSAKPPLFKSLRIIAVT